MKKPLPLSATSLLWLIQQSPAAAAGPPLTDLYGYSLIADWSIDETETCSSCSANIQPYVTTKHFTEKVYVSNRCRLFHNRNTAVNNMQRSNFSLITTNNTQPLIYDPTVGFISRVIPSDYNKDKTTFVRVTDITLTKTGGGFSCDISTKLVLKVSQERFIFFAYDNFQQRGVYEIHSFGLTKSTCSVFKGNIFSS
jgi:hypothetical protein